MIFLFRNETALNKLKVLEYLVSDTWMCLERGEGEKEIDNHGWSRVKVFSQETGDEAQRTPRIGAHGQKKSQVQDAHDSLTLTPLFFSFSNNRGEK